MWEVQTRIWFDGWVNIWGTDECPEHFDTEQDAEDAICEFFANLSRSGMAQGYDKEDYRVARVTNGVSHN